jgi:hypothetical protein
MSRYDDKYVPTHNIGYPKGPNPTPPPPPVRPNTPIYSSYTQQFIQYGPVLKGTISDAPIGHPNYGKPFHVTEYNPANESYMIHRQGPITDDSYYSPSPSSNYGSSYGSSYGSYSTTPTVHQGGYVTGVSSYGYSG